MKFAEIIKSNSWIIVEPTLIRLYPNEEKQIEGYEKIYADLLLLTPTDEDMSIVVSNQMDDFDGEKYVDVSGRLNDPSKVEPDTPNSYAIEFSPWEEWLGMEVAEESLTTFSEPEIIAHCLFEMTFVGFDQEEIQAEMKEIMDEVDEIKNMTEEEKKEKLIPWEDVKKRLDLETD